MPKCLHMSLTLSKNQHANACCGILILVDILFLGIVNRIWRRENLLMQQNFNEASDNLMWQKIDDAALKY